MISEEQYAEAQAEWDAAGPPAPMDTGTASWGVVAIICLAALVSILSGWLDDLGDWD